jgi:hypothetical protein
VRPDGPLPPTLGSAKLVAGDGRAVTVDALFDGRPLLLVFLRHFGCIACAEQVHSLLPRLDELAALGVRVVLVGSGAPEHIGAFLERHDLADKKVEVYTDPSLASFAAAGLARSFWATWGPRAIVAFVRALSRGYRQGASDGDMNQQGGALLVDADRTVVWLYRSTNLGENADPSDVVEAALRLRIRHAPLPV